MAAHACLSVFGVLAVPLDPELVEERTQIKEGVREWDKRTTVVGSVLYPLAILIVAGLDARYDWSPGFPTAVTLAALAISAADNLTGSLATAVNRFWGRFVRIQRERGQIVICDGPCRYARHPVYLGRKLLNLACVLALGSRWALIPGGLFAVLLVVRTALEDRTLQE